MLNQGGAPKSRLETYKNTPKITKTIDENLNNVKTQ